MTKKHLQFCIYYMQVGDPLVAYKMTYPRAAVKSLSASVSRLMARPDVAEWVNGTEERVHNRMMRKFHNEHYDKFKDQLLTINQKRTVLTKIITGETKRVRYVQAKYGLQKIEEPLPVYAVLRAVDLDTRLENFYNYLTRSDTWRKTQNIYVNTPTLQQQVNILISQTTEKEVEKNTQEQALSPDDFVSDVLSPAACPDYFGGGGDPARAGSGVEHSRRAPAQDTSEPEKPSPPGRACPAKAGGEPGNSAEGGWAHSREEIPPLKEVAHERVTEDVYSHRTDNTSPHHGVPIAIGIGVHPRRTTKTPRYLKNGPTTSLTKLNKTPDQLPGNTSGKTQPGGNHPPRESSS